jgi:hypothetical protein
MQTIKMLTSSLSDNNHAARYEIQLLWNAMLGIPNNAVSCVGTKASGLFVCDVLVHQSFNAPFYETPKLELPPFSAAASLRDTQTGGAATSAGSRRRVF